MNTSPNADFAAQVEARVRERLAPLLRNNGALREQVARLQLVNQELSRRLGEAPLGSTLEPDSKSESKPHLRGSTVNLIQDAEDAHFAEERAAAERRRSEDEAREADRRNDEFLATLAHELRNPLAPLQNSMHLIRRTNFEDAETQRVYDIMERQLNHMVQLVDDLMEVSRITRGKIALRSERVELADMIRNAVDNSKSLIDEAGHELTVSLPPEPIHLFVDPVRFVQVLANLLNNATRYTERPGRIQLAARREGSQLVVSVRDNGVGIPSNMLPRVFDLFTHGDHPHHLAQGGLGIGLTLVRRLMDLHGGSVEARSEGPGRGSEFLIRLPISEGKVESPKRPIAQPHARATIASRRILVVDDNVDSANTLGRLLTLLGAEVAVAHDGPSALKAVQTHNPSVALLDIGMPDMDGNEVARRIRAEPENRNIALIALTGWGQDEDRRRTSEAGFNHHLVKPVDLDELQSLLAKLPLEARS